MPKIEVDRKTGEVSIEGDCGAEWEGKCGVVKVTKDKIILNCETELTKECPEGERDVEDYDTDSTEDMANMVNELGWAQVSLLPMAKDVVDTLEEWGVDATYYQEEPGIDIWRIIRKDNKGEMETMQLILKEGEATLADITNVGDLRDHISLSITDYVRTMQWQVYNQDHTFLTAERLQEALEEDTGSHVDYDLCTRILNQERANWMIEYFDPEDEKGERSRIWYFHNIEDAAVQQEELMAAWEAKRDEIKIINLLTGKYRPRIGGMI